MNNNKQRDKDVQRIILIEGSVNLVVLAAKTVVGFSTGSLAILSDAIHSLTDVVNNMIAWTVVRLSSTPADRKHPYGHRKFETLAVFFLASLLVLLSFELALQAITRDDTEIVNSAWGMAVMLAVLIVNITVSIWQRMWARRLQSDILLADASHTFSDVLTTIVVIVGWQLSTMGYVWLDRVCALGVSALVLYLAFVLFKKSLPILTDEYSIEPELISKSIENINGLRQIRRIRSRWIGADKSIDLIVSVDPHISTNESHEITSTIEQRIEEEYGISDISIHVEPFDENIDQ
jgi:cation diffusion facilitator family transporter